MEFYAYSYYYILLLASAPRESTPSRLVFTQPL